MDAKARFEEIVDDVLARNAEVELTQMMGMPALKKHGKLWVGLWNDEMVFKLVDGEAHEQALALDGAHLFDPGGRGRPFKEWVAVPPAHEQTWPQLTERALR
jgi:hypothetical protein